MPNYQCHKTTTLATLQGALASDPLGSSLCRTVIYSMLPKSWAQAWLHKACVQAPASKKKSNFMQGATFPTLHQCQIKWIWSNLVSKTNHCTWQARDRQIFTEIAKNPIEKKRQVTQFPKLGAKFLNRKISTGKDFESPEQETKTTPVLYSDPSTVITGAGSRQLSSWLHSEGSSYNSPSRHRSEIILHQWIKQIQIRRQIQSEVPFHSPFF